MNIHIHSFDFLFFDRDFCSSKGSTALHDNLFILSAFATVIIPLCFPAVPAASVGQRDR